MTDMRTNDGPRTDILEGSYQLDIPDEILQNVPDDVRADDTLLRQYLLRALSIGIQAIGSASVNLDLTIIQRAFEEVHDTMTEQQEHAQKALTELLESDLTGEDSKLVRQLQHFLGEEGKMAKILQKLADPENTGSIPLVVREELEKALEDESNRIGRLLDSTDPDSQLGQFLRTLQTQQDNLNTKVDERMKAMQLDFEKQMGEWREALRIDERQAEHDEELAEMLDKSTQKGIHFENDAVDELLDIAGAYGDEIEHTGGEGEGGTRRKVGDIVIVINSPGIDQIRVSIEAKSGGISKKDLLRQIRAGVDNRNADCGIGLMDLKHKQVRQDIYEEHGENLLICVDWANQEWLSLEVAYRSLRARLIAEEVRARSEDEIDQVALSKHIQDALSELSEFQSMKNNTSEAVKLMTGVRQALDAREKGILDHLKRAERLLK